MALIDVNRADSTPRGASGAPSQAPPAPGRATPWVLSTYFAEGLPFSIVHQLSAQFFTFVGASLEAVGLTALYGLAWNLKFLWSPLVDRYGTARRWVFLTQLGLGVVVLALAIPAGERDVVAVARGLVAVAVLAATHDVAVDGFYLRALHASDQAALSGLRVGAYRAALLVGNGALVVLAGRTSWGAAFAVAGGLLLALGAVHARSLPDPPRKPATGASAAVDYVDAFASFLKQPRVAVAVPFILAFKAGDALMFAMSTPFLKSLGFRELGSGLVSGLGVAASVLGTTLAGAAISRVELRRSLLPVAAAQSLAILLYVWLAAAQPGTLAIAAVVVVEQFVGGVGNAALLVFLMRRCYGAHKAAHFAMASALMSVTVTVAGVASGFLAARLGFPTFFAVAFAASLPGVALARFAPTEPAA